MPKTTTKETKTEIWKRADIGIAVGRHKHKKGGNVACDIAFGGLKIIPRMVQDDTQSAQDGPKTHLEPIMGSILDHFDFQNRSKNEALSGPLFWIDFGSPFGILFGLDLATSYHVFSERAQYVIFEGPPMRNNAFSQNFTSKNRSKINQKRNQEQDRN